MTAWYLDWPGFRGPEVSERLIDSVQEAEANAVLLYQQGRMPKVAVCEFPSLRVVKIISGERATPSVQNRR